MTALAAVVGVWLSAGGAQGAMCETGDRTDPCCVRKTTSCCCHPARSPARESTAMTPAGPRVAAETPDPGCSCRADRPEAERPKPGRVETVRRTAEVGPNPFASPTTARGATYRADRVRSHPSRPPRLLLTAHLLI